MRYLMIILLATALLGGCKKKGVNKDKGVKIAKSMAEAAYRCDDVSVEEGVTYPVVKLDVCGILRYYKCSGSCDKCGDNCDIKCWEIKPKKK